MAEKEMMMFAASLLVAGQWDPAQIASLSKANLWFVASVGDDLTYAGVNACIASLQKAGAKVSTASWSGQSSISEYASDVSRMLAEGGNIKYTVLKKGTVVPNGITDNADNNHANTCRVAYTIEGLRDWLFTQVKTPKS